MMSKQRETTNGHSNKDDEPKMQCVDGNWAVAHAAYRMNDTAFIFPITPSSPMGEEVDEWAAQHKKNIWGYEMDVVEMQSEAGAAGALHGALVSGSLATTFTASQGLLLYIPNLYKIAGELLPTVIHVASRALAGEALSIYGDHSDTMLVRGCGLAMISSFSVQEAHDMAIVCQMATLNSRVPFLHFMDGFRTSHEINKISLVSDEQLLKLLPQDQIDAHRQRALSPMHPTQRGTAQAPDVFMQLVESSNVYYNAVENIFEQALMDFSSIAGRTYKAYEYYYFGSTKPRVAIVTMGSSVKVVQKTLEKLASEQACLVAVRMFRPWSAKAFVDVIPENVTRVAVLDRTREGGSQGEPLYLEVCSSLVHQGRSGVFVAGGRYGLGSKDYTPQMVNSVIHNLLRKHASDIQRPFTVGITDDVTNLSLPLGRAVNIFDDSVTQCVFWGFGSDGTVGANKEAIKMIGNYHKSMSVQAYFEYDAKKSSGWTVSHLRFSPTWVVEAPFRVEDGQASFVACHNESYVQASKFNVIRYLKRRGTFFLNTSIASIEDQGKRIAALETLVSPKILRRLSLLKAKFYIMDAARIASSHGLAGRINMACSVAFFRLSGVIPLDDAISLLKSSLRRAYSSKGEEVVQKNIDLVDAVVGDPMCLVSVDVPDSWSQISADPKAYENRHVALIDDEKVKNFMAEVGDPVNRLDGDSIPVSTFLRNNLLGGVMIPGTSKFEKRNPNPSGRLPQWEPNNCTQCNQCVFVCPHAAIRPFIVTKDEASAAPFHEGFKTLKATGSEFVGKRYTLQVSVLDCTGCNACVEACPEAPKALQMDEMHTSLEKGEKIWNYASSLPERGYLIQKNTVRGSQFQTPLVEFSGACSGCGETPYFKLLTQLFGERMIIANATGCSTIWGGSFPSNPYTTSAKTGRGPAWANSLFEDNAEYGLGMFTATKHRRGILVRAVMDFVHHVDLSQSNGDMNSDLSNLTSLLTDWLEIRDEKSDRCTHLFDKMKPLFERLLDSENGGEDHTHMLKKIWSERDMFPKLSQWIVGGDGWAYDIGFGGLDHVEAFEANDVNVLVVDTEMYSNTGGQKSKATPAGASVKFAMGGKEQRKKNIGELFMTYEHVYVASVALSNQAQVLQAMVEADQYHGPSIVVAYAPCIQQGVRPLGLNDMFDECRLAVDTGYWPLYRYNPDYLKLGQNPFTLDCKKLRKDVSSFLQHERRFVNLMKKEPTLATHLWETMNADIRHRMDHLNQLASDYKASDESAPRLNVLFASETGTAARVARDFACACPFNCIASAMDDFDVDDIDGMTTVFFVSTCGQGAMPQNGRSFVKALQMKTESFTDGTNFMMFGLGDSSYYFFLKAAKDVEELLVTKGATKILSLGEGDDNAEGGMGQGLHDWLMGVWPVLELPPPSEVPHIEPVKVSYSDRAVSTPGNDQLMILQYFLSEDIRAIDVPILDNVKLCREDYGRDFRSVRIQKASGLEYHLGDALDIFPTNDTAKVEAFLHDYSPDFGQNTVVTVHDFGIDGDVSLKALFTDVLDLFGKPSRHFVQQLATFVTDASVRQEMLEPGFIVDLAKKSGTTTAELLLRFKEFQPPLPALLAMIPVIRPRAYSIASSPRASDSFIELLILIDTWWCEEGERCGLTCDMIRKLKPGDHIKCRIKTGSMEPPPPDVPVLCAGIGSGLAPHMAFLRDRVWAAQQGDTVERFSLYFGNRKKDEEFLYQKELEHYVDKYDWFKLHTAFSRDGAKKVYVQDLVGATDDARVLLYENDEGLLYVCGNRNLPRPLQEALVKSFSHGDPSTTEKAAEAVKELYLRSRAQQEVW